MRDFSYLTIGMVIKRFILGWLIGGIMLVLYSCIEYIDIIKNVISNTARECISAFMPLVIIFFVVSLILGGR